MSQRDRRMQGRNRGRERRPQFHGQQPHGSHTHVERETPAGHPGGSELPAEQRSLLQQAREDVERIQEVLESVLRDLDEVSEQLTKAEHEKDLAEAEIEQLRESLRRLHR